MKITAFALLAAAIGVAAPLSANAQDVAPSLAATCAACHGTNGRSVTTEVTSLATLPKETIVQRMNEFREGKRPATIMHQIAKGYTDQQIEAIASYLSGQKK